MDERLYTISFSKIYALGRHRERARKAMKYLRAFSARHMKTTEEMVVIGTDVNEYLWRNGIQRPPRKLRVKMMRDKDGTVMVALEQSAEKKEAKEFKEKKKEDNKGVAKGATKGSGPSGEKKVEAKPKAEVPKKEEKKPEVKKETPAPKAEVKAPAAPKP